MRSSRFNSFPRSACGTREVSDSVGAGAILKRFLPNFVMIDFASERKCQTIYELNRLIPQEMTKMELLMIEMRKLV